MADEHLTPQELKVFCNYFYDHTGIRFEENKDYFIERRIFSRMRQLQINGFPSYFLFVKSTPLEFQHLVNALTIHETYFFRENEHFRCLVDHLLPILQKGPSRLKNNIRIWSIPCSTGEELYSIALYLLEFWPDLSKVEVELVGSDISDESIAKAKIAEYNQRSIHHVPAPILQKYFTSISPQSYALNHEVRDAVVFNQHNLLDGPKNWVFRNFDIIFCRNLLIYFDDGARRRAGEILYESLNNGGYILLGHAESMSRVSSLFEIKRYGDAIVYQKPI